MVAEALEATPLSVAEALEVTPLSVAEALEATTNYNSSHFGNFLRETQTPRVG